MMSAQKLIRVYIDLEDGSKAMEQIHEAAGDDTWRIVTIVSSGGGPAAKQASPGINDPLRLQGEPVLVLLERDGNPVDVDFDRSLLESVH